MTKYRVLFKMGLALIALFAALFAVNEAAYAQCTGCTTTIVMVDGEPCMVQTCTDPNYPACLTPGGSTACTPGTGYSVKTCTPLGMQVVLYTCQSGSFQFQSATDVTNGSNATVKTYCNYFGGQGCARADNGDLLGIPTTERTWCAPSAGLVTDVQEGACGDPPCRIPARCIKNGQVRCPTPTPPAVTPTAPPPSVCPRGACVKTSACGWTCSWDGLGLANPNSPVPQVVRAPYPRGLVSVPNQLSITSSCIGPKGGPSGIERELNDSAGAFRTCGGTEIWGYRVAWSWVCGSPGTPYDIGASWDMNERAWNVDKVNDKGETIEATRYGISINHTYETSSYGLPENGPGSGARQPAYQVQLTTHWLMAANFERRIKTTEGGCWHADSDTQPENDWDAVSPCLSQDDCRVNPNQFACQATNRRSRTSLTWQPDVAYVYPDVVSGAYTPQDSTRPGGCSQPIPIPMLKMDTVIASP